jgi:hypothetical protein
MPRSDLSHSEIVNRIQYFPADHADRKHLWGDHAGYASVMGG